MIGPVLLLSLRVLLHTGPVRYKDFMEALTLRDLFLYLYFEGFSNPLQLEFLLESYTPDFEGNSLLQLVLRRDEVARAE